MRILSALVLVMLINSSVWAYFILRASDPHSSDAKKMASQIQRVLQSPARITSTTEVNAILHDLGPYTLRENSGPLEFGFAAGSVRKKLIQGPEVLHYVRVGGGQANHLSHTSRGRIFVEAVAYGPNLAGRLPVVTALHFQRSQRRVA